MKIVRCLAAVAAAVVLLPVLASAQTLSLTNGVHVFEALTNATVTITGQTELRLNSTNVPLSGCVIHLNSPGAWVLFPNLRPATVSASFLSQIRVNGALATSGSNIRVDQHAMGTLLVPHAPGYQPLQVFEGPQFTGASRQLSLYTYYTNTSTLGAFYRGIGSFKLKRGYSVTLAQNPNGTGISRVYIAQDGDLEIATLDTNLNRAAGFVRVVPWRWTSKKGWGGGISQGSLVDPLWSYDWDNATTSTANTEYVPMRHNSTWNAYSNINGKQKSTHALGFNEPDREDQANMTVAAAIGQWPNLLQSGLRLGAPGVSDSSGAGVGPDWVYQFMDEANALNYRVDFVPIHFYKCNWTASQFYNYLLSIYNTTGRPVWVTEFNNGANWCSGTPPTLEQNAQRMSEFLDMLESAPFVERYAIFNWVGSEREMITSSNTLTPAGIIYRDRKSNLSYTQILPVGGARSIAQFGFNTNALDSSGFGNNGMTIGNPVYGPGVSGEAATFDGTNSYVLLPPNIANSPAFSFAAWMNWDGGGNWQRIFDFGDDTTHYLFLTPSSGSSTLRFAIRNGGSEQIIQCAPLPTGQWHHVAVTLAGSTARLYTNGVLAASSTGFSIVPSQFNPSRNFLGESQFAADPLFRGSLDNVLITDFALSQGQIASLLTNQPPQFSTNYINGGTANYETSYSGTLNGLAADPDPGDTLTFSKSGGPAWLAVAADGTLSGTPGPADGGTNFITVRVSDSAGNSAHAVLKISVPLVNLNGTWISNADGLWSESSRWSGGAIANGPGFSANFSTLNISANRVVTLDTSRSIGTLRFSDTSGAQTWTLVSTNGSLLTLDTGSATSPSIVVTNTATLALPVNSDNGFAKTGPGTLVLSEPNFISGTVTIDTASTTTYEGIVRAAHPDALGNVTNLLIRNNNSGSSTLQLDGSNGDVSIPCRITANCRNVTTPTIQNLSGTNTLSGFIALESGGGAFNLQSDSGMLILSGTNRYLGTLTGGRSYNFSGNGDFLVSGPIQAATNGAPIALSKTGSGTLILAGANTYTNTTTLSGGRLLVNGSLGTTPVIAMSGTTLGGGGAIRGSVTIQAGAILAPGNSIGRLTVSNALTLQAGSSTRLELDRSLPTNDVLRVTGLFTRAGTLVVTNTGPDLQAGDTFDLFEVSSSAGAFASVVLPPLSPNLFWNTNQLATTGVISVEAILPPQMSFTVSNGSELLLQLTTQAGINYTLQSATNLESPVLWLDEETLLGNAGVQSFQRSITNEPKRFFRVLAH